jgi:hypothetical protein
MIDSSMDASAMREALARIAKQADFLDVTVHAGRGVERTSFHASIEEAYALLLSGAALAVKLSYRVADLAWSDTLTPAKDGFRLLRVRRASGGGWALGGE